ncbi:MAG TPA: PIN domain-containing protein [Turneriella sp.]|nr:PIN domain-containing protein [Turneriella sp.]HNL09904.1 PIN domain-containing protein [Turneriella sp.]HNL53370.1 PIN domain-containing protein [Turneriella sp.]HNN01698.1 PIN domain-containing protein [Turneriella sp.]
MHQEDGAKVLVDTSVWIDFLHGKTTAQRMHNLLETNRVLVHDFVEAELRVGQINKDRESFFRYLQNQPRAKVIAMPELIDFVERKSLYGRGLSFIDIALVIAAIVENGWLWTHDRALHKLAEELAIDFH